MLIGDDFFGGGGTRFEDLGMDAVDEMRSEVEAQSDKGATGSFEVEVNGQLIHAKKAGDVFAAENAGTSLAFISQVCVF